jgi:hypothetical protein
LADASGYLYRFKDFMPPLQWWGSAACTTIDNN